MEKVAIFDLTVAVGNKVILRVERAEFEPGRIYGIVGPSGSGKSTLLRSINLLEPQAKGLLHFWGTTLPLPAPAHSKCLPIQRQMALVAQKPVMFQTSVFENVAMGLRFRRVDRKTVQQRVMNALELVELSHCAKQQASTLSGGEAQRIALARAIVLQPRLLLLDEPTANLDPYNVAIFERVVAGIQRETATTILIVTHNLPQARRLSHACLFVHKGTIVETEETPRFFDQPRSSELQDFLTGRMIY